MGKRNFENAADEPEGFGPEVDKAGGGYVVLAWLLALGWLGAAAAGLYAAYGLDQLRAAAPVAQAAMGAFGALPALMILFSGLAMREGARGRAQARALAIAAERMLSPSPRAESEARRLGVSVRGEIAALDRALDQTLQKVREVEAVVARQTMAVDSAAAMAQSGARSIVGGLERERAELLQISDELNAQAGSIGQAISRHTRLIADAARLAEAEVRAADEALDSRLSSFGAAAALISDRTAALTKAAQASAESALRLENALSTALDSLAQATALTDAAKKSAETATFAANTTAGAVRETTLRAVEDAKRAAEMIRAEAASVERAGMEAIQRLRDASSDARSDARKPLPEPARAEAERRRPEPGPRTADPSRAETFAHPRAEMARPDPRRMAPPPAPPRSETTEPAIGSDAPIARDQNRWTWKDVLAAIDDDTATKPAAAPRARQPDPLAAPRARQPEPPAAPPAPRPRPIEAFDAGEARPRSDRPDSGRSGSHNGGESNAQNAAKANGWGFSMRGGRPSKTIDPTYDRFRASDPPEDEPDFPTSQSAEGALIAAAGVALHEVFNPHALERIAQRAKSGTQTRRRAVREAAPEAVMRLAQHLDDSSDARARAAAFLRAEGARISELLGRGRASMGSESTRAFLLLDAASA